LLIIIVARTKYIIHIVVSIHVELAAKVAWVCLRIVHLASLMGDFFHLLLNVLQLIPRILHLLIILELDLFGESYG